MSEDHHRQSLDPASLPPAGRTTIADGWVTDKKRWEPGMSMAASRRRPGDWAATGQGAHIGYLKVERDLPRVGPQALASARFPEYKYSVDDVPGAAPMPRPGQSFGPRILPNGLSSTFDSNRYVDPVAPGYNIPEGYRTERCITSPRENERSVMPIGGRNESKIDQYPLTRAMMNPGSKPCTIGCADILGANSSTGYGIKERKKLYQSLDYGDVFCSKGCPARHDAGHHTIYAGKQYTHTVVPGPEGKRNHREPFDTQKPMRRLRKSITNPLTPLYDFDPNGQLCRQKQMYDGYMRKHPEHVMQRHTLAAPLEGELLGRMQAFNPAGGKRAAPGKLNTMYQTRPFPTVQDWRH